MMSKKLLFKIYFVGPVPFIVTIIYLSDVVLLLEMEKGTGPRRYHHFTIPSLPSFLLLIK